MHEKTDMQLAAAVRIIEKLIKGDSGADREAEEFLRGIESGELPEPRRFFLNVAKGPKELPGFAAYVEIEYKDNPEGEDEAVWIRWIPAGYSQSDDTGVPEEDTNVK